MSSPTTRLLGVTVLVDDYDEAIAHFVGDLGFHLVEDTTDFAAHHARLVERGVRMTEEPRVEAYGTVVVFEDRYGNRWDLIQPVGGHGGR